MNQTLALVTNAALAPDRHVGRSTRRPRLPAAAWVTLVALAACVSTARAQTATGKSATGKSVSKPAATKVDAKPAAKDATTKGAADAKAADPKAADVKSEADKSAEAAEAAAKIDESAEVFRDPLMEDALKNTFRSLSVRPLALEQIHRVRSMAAGEASIDAGVMKQYVDFAVSELTNRTNIAALLEAPSAKLPATSLTRLAIQNAGENLVQPIFAARSMKPANTAFLNAYTPILIQTLPKVLDNHFYARIEAMIALATAASPDALPIFVKQLGDPKQTVWVKLWAARGISAVFDNGRNPVDITRALAAAKALAVFLSQDDLPWPAQVRGLEALGSTRQSSGSPLQGKIELYEVAARYLADESSNIQVRCYAAWAAGMTPVGPRAAPKFNYAMVAYRIGALAAETAQAASTSAKANPERTKAMTALLLYQLYPALAGEPGVRDSGLVYASASSKDAAFVKQVRDGVQALASGSVELTRSAGGMVARTQKDLAEQIASLKAVLEKNRPTDWHLIPGGAEYPLADVKAARDDAKP